MTTIRCELKHRIKFESKFVVMFVVKINFSKRASNGTNQLIPMICFPLGFVDIAKYLIEEGAKVDATDNGGSTPRQLASQNRKSIILPLFFTISLLAYLSTKAFVKTRLC